MKTTMITLLLFLSIFNVKAQSTAYHEAMKTAISQFNEAQNAADYLAAANRFEQIGTQAKDQWLPYYYSAYALLVNNTQLEDGDQKDRVLDKALQMIDRANNLQTNNSEIYTMRGYLKFMKLYVNPMVRMQAGMADALADLEKAKTLDTNNPRPYFIIAQNTFYTPAAFGGGKAAAKPLLQEAAAKFEAFKPADDLMPDWGKARNASLLAQCQ